jgi:hypothetical protein
MADGYARVMTEREIHHFRYGTIYDSPDGKNFMTRYAYSHDDIAKLAEDNRCKCCQYITRGSTAHP